MAKLYKHINYTILWLGTHFYSVKCLKYIKEKGSDKNDNCGKISCCIYSDGSGKLPSDEKSADSGT